MPDHRCALNAQGARASADLAATRAAACRMPWRTAAVSANVTRRHLGIHDAASQFTVRGVQPRATLSAADRESTFSEAASARHARVVVPPTRTAKVSRRGTALECSQLYNHRRGDARAPLVEEGLGATIGRLVWRTLLSGTRPSLGMAFAPVVLVAGASRRAFRSVLNRMTELGSPERLRSVGDEALGREFW